MVTSYNPRTGKVLKKFKPDSKEKILKVIANAKKAQKKWVNADRIKYIKKLKEVIKENKLDIIKVVSREIGTSKSDTYGAINKVIECIPYYIQRYKEIEPKTGDYEGDKIEIRFYPIGVIGQIGVWNFPFWQTMMTLIPALIAGNTLVVKASEYSTMSSLKIKDLMNKAGFPKGVFDVVIGSGREGRILAQSDVDMLVFTGCIATGKDILKYSGIKKFLFEMSGNDAAIICNDCDIEQTIEGLIWASVRHSGEVCTRAKRIYVEKGISKEFIEKLQKNLKKDNILKEITPLISKSAVKNLDKQVKTLIKQGAKVLLKGNVPKKGFYYPHMLLKIVKNKKNNKFLPRNELFGPIVCVTIVEDWKEGVKLANDTNFGLGASVWTKNTAKGKKIADLLEAGNVWINNSSMSSIGADYFYGWKESGFSYSEERLKLFMKSKRISDNVKVEKKDWWF